MKKIISLILVLILMLSVAVMPTFAKDTLKSTVGGESLFIEEFIEQYGHNNANFEYLCRENYNEEYYHYDVNNQLEWVLVYCLVSVTPSNNYVVFGDMVSFHGASDPLGIGYGVYDVASQKFIDIVDLDDLSEYEGLKDHIYDAGLLYPIGDYDLDKKLTVLDATGIQRLLAGLVPDDDIINDSYRNQKSDNELKYSTDIDRDGKRTVMDATAIQLKLAWLE